MTSSASTAQGPPIIAMNTTATTPAATATFRVLAADKLAAEGLEFLKQQTDVELVNKPGLSEDELAAIAGQHDGMIVRSGVQVTAKVLANPGRLKVIARAGVGVDEVQIEIAGAALGQVARDATDAAGLGPPGVPAICELRRYAFAPGVAAAPRRAGTVGRRGAFA